MPKNNTEQILCCFICKELHYVLVKVNGLKIATAIRIFNIRNMPQ